MSGTVQRRKAAFTGWLLIAVLMSFSVSVRAAEPSLGCLVKPKTVVTVGTPAIGVLKTVAVEPGASIKEGEVLATLDSSMEEAEVELARAKANLEAPIYSAEEKASFSARKVARARELRKSAAIAKHELDEAETEERLAQAMHREALENRRLAELELKRAEAALALRTLHSPINGVVIDRFLSPGELVKQMPILQVAQLDPLQVDVYAPVAWLGKIRPGMKAEVRVNGPIAGVYSASVTEVNPVVNTAGGTFNVGLHLPNPEHRIPAGLPCTVRFLSQ